MHSFLKIKRFMATAFAVTLCAAATFAQQPAGTLRGKIVDEFGASIVGATVMATSESGAEKTAATNEEGVYVLNGLAPGNYRVRASANGFAADENSEVKIAAGQHAIQDITLKVTIEKQEVTVAADLALNTDPENNKGALVLRGSDLDTLPDDPDDLESALQALAGPSAGPNGGQIYIDGFTGGRLPPKASIREIRINSNPFSAEYDRLGFGRIEILTRPGTDTFRGQGFFNFTDESLNSRNPFAATRAPYQSRQYGGNLSGPVIKKKASFFLDFERREIDDDAVINATVLDANLNISPLIQTVLTPQRRTTFSPRLDYAINKNNTLVGRYTYTNTSAENSGIGNFSLASRAYDTSSTEHTVQLTETAIINQKIVNETRFQFIRRRSAQNGDNTIPTINVLDAFTGGGSQVGISFNDENRWELQNNTSFAIARHTLKAGLRLRGVSLTNVSAQNFGGAFTFAGGLAPQLDAGNQIVLDAAGQPVLIPITSIERYRRTLLFQQQGLSAAEIIARGGGATQFTIAGGDPEAHVSQTDLGAFVQDDWRVSNSLSLNLGLRYERQTNINSRFNFAPRLGFAWAPRLSGQAQPATVVRGGFGIFYDRIGESLTLQADRFNGTNQQQYIVTDPTVLAAFPTVPSIAMLGGFATEQTKYQLANDIQSPYTMQSVISLEHQFPRKFTLTTIFINARTLHLLRARNINAPLPGTYTEGVAGSGVRPYGNAGNIFQYESSGRLNQNQLIVNLSNRFGTRATLFASYILGKAESDTDGSGSFPASSYDLSAEYGRSSFDTRHRFIFGGSFSGPLGLSFNPFIIASSGRPFNITTGQDTNGDSLFTERPSFAAASASCTDANIVCTSYGKFNLNPAAGEELIPRNYGTGPAFFTVNLRVSKSFSFGGESSASAFPRGGGFPGGGGGPGGPGGGGPPPGGGGPPPGGGPGGGPPPGGGGDRRYILTFSVQAQNLLNNTNAGTPIGNLSSSLFGQTNMSAGGFGFGPGGGGAASLAYNRRIEAQIRFSF